MWAIMYVVYAGMPANVPQVTSTSFSELLKIPLPSEIEMVTELEKLEHTEASGTLWVRESIQTTNLPVIVVNALVTLTGQWHLYNPT